MAGPGTEPAACCGSQGQSFAQRGPGTPLRAREMLSNGGDVPLASEEGAAAGTPKRGLEEQEGTRGCRPRAEIPFRQHLSCSRDTPVAQGRACARTGRRGRREEWPGGAGRDTPQPISTPMPLGVMGRREKRLNFILSFSPFKPILFDNTCNFPHYLSGLPMTVMGH